MKVGSVVEHWRLKKGPGTIIKMWVEDGDNMVAVLWQRDLLVQVHLELALKLVGVHNG